MPKKKTELQPVSDFVLPEQFAQVAAYAVQCQLADKTIVQEEVARIIGDKTALRKKAKRLLEHPEFKNVVQYRILAREVEVLPATYGVWQCFSMSALKIARRVYENLVLDEMGLLPAADRIPFNELLKHMRWIAPMFDTAQQKLEDIGNKGTKKRSVMFYMEEMQSGGYFENPADGLRVARKMQESLAGLAQGAIERLAPDFPEAIEGAVPVTPDLLEEPCTSNPE